MKHLVFTSAMIFAFFIGFSKTKSIRQELNYVVTDRGIMLPEDAINAFRGNFFLNSDKLENYKLRNTEQNMYCNKDQRRGNTNCWKKLDQMENIQFINESSDHPEIKTIFYYSEAKCKNTELTLIIIKY
jgi:hypothetical protein